MRSSLIVPQLACVTVALLVSTQGNSQDMRSLQNRLNPGIGVSVKGMRSGTGVHVDPHELSIQFAPVVHESTGDGSVFLVTTTNDTGDGSLRKAITSANTNPGLDMIAFNIPPSGTKTIIPLSKLPNIVDPVILDGTTQPGFVDKPMIELNCSNVGPYQALDVFAPGTTIRGLVINRLTGGTGIVLHPGSSGSVIEGNFFGTNLTGTIRVGNAYNGIICESSNNRIGGTAPGARNVFAGHGNPTIALISGGNENVVQGNLIGTDVTGTVRLGNTEDGILIIFGARDDTIGGNTAAERNIISASDNYSGIAIIGTGSGGTQGIHILGNYIGTDITGNLDFGNARNGIYVRHSPQNRIGGTDPGERNVISGNTLPGIQIDSAGAANNVIQGNIIGTRPNGTFALANSKGIVLNDAPGNLIGGSATGARNLITGNSGVGIEITGIGATRNNVQGNFIGTDISGQPGPRNLSHGILISASQDTIGGLNQGEGNLIAYNTGAGVYVTDGTQNVIWGNRMRLNTGLGIDLAPQGVTVNDSLDPDTGPNALQNFPLLDSAVVTAGDITIHGRLNSWRNASYTIHFYKNGAADGLHFGEGDSLIGSTNVTTNDSGNARFSVTLPALVAPDQYVTATATSSPGHTSEFSQALSLGDLDGDGIMDSWETQGWGIDVNSDAIIDLDLHALGARPDHKDLFVEVDAMTGMSPQPGAMQKVANAFAAVPNQYVNNPDGGPGITLHVQMSDTTLGLFSWPTNWWTHFYNIKRDTFGTVQERSSPNSRHILEAKRLVFRYCVFAYSRGTDGVSGQGELPGNDFMVTLGEWDTSGGTRDEQAGTFMHELGHTLGLFHGGVDNIHFKPNYFSVMNYAWQVPYGWHVPGDWMLNYSVRALDTLNESMLDERIGLNPPALSFPVVSVPYTGPGDTILHARLRPNSPVDWNGNGIIDTVAVTGDINRLDMGVRPEPVPDKFLASRGDWSSLIYNFRTASAFNDGESARLADGDTLDELDLRAYRVLDSLPPPVPHHFGMDGQIDPEAVRLTSGAGIALYGAYRDGELYVATNSAQSRNADMFVFVALDFGNPGIQAPWLKSGQVAAWSAFLGNESQDNSVGWYQANGTRLRSISKSAASAGIVEGVIDLEYLGGVTPYQVFMAVGKYQTVDGGVLLAQAPPGDGDGDIEAGTEFHSFIPGVERHWYQTAGPASENVFSLFAPGPDELYAGAGNGGYKTTDGGDSWTHLTAGLPQDRIFDFEVTANGYVYAATDSGIYFSTNNGGVWQPRSHGLTQPEARAVIASPLGTLFAGTFVGGFRSTDAGANWILVPGLPQEGVTALAIDSSGYLLAGSSSQGLFRSTDDGMSWASAGISAPNVRSITVDRLGRIYYVKSSPSIVYRSTDGGVSWSNILQTSMGTQQIGVDEGGSIYAATAEGVLLSVNDAATWEDITEGVPGQSTWSLTVAPDDNVYVGTFTAGVCRRLSPTITAIGDPTGELPDRVLLYQNYPNPFNPSTRIEYAVPRGGHVTIMVYNILGQQVTALVNEEKPAGRYTVDWNASDKSTGVYFCTMMTEGVAQTIKLLVLR